MNLHSLLITLSNNNDFDIQIHVPNDNTVRIIILICSNNQPPLTRYLSIHIVYHKHFQAEYKVIGTFLMIYLLSVVSDGL